MNVMTYGHVVRLKGGDPFIFWRGEEIDYVESFGIPTFVVPGSSSLCSSFSGISLTKEACQRVFG
jgi:uroporphyrin-III C-methyltransferase